MAASVACCAHCGETGVALKHCARCKQVSYCGAECQKLAWKGHKTTCAPPLMPPGEETSVGEIFQKVVAAREAGDWRAVLKWERCMKELLKGFPDHDCNQFLMNFSWAHEARLQSTHSRDHALSVIALEEWRVEIFGRMERFRDQGASLNVPVGPFRFFRSFRSFRFFELPGGHRNLFCRKTL